MKAKLELTWFGKGGEPKLEPRILIEDPEKSYGDPNSENMLIHRNIVLYHKREIGADSYAQLQQKFYIESVEFEEPVVYPFTKIEPHIICLNI